MTAREWIRADEVEVDMFTHMRQYRPVERVVYVWKGRQSKRRVVAVTLVMSGDQRVTLNPDERVLVAIP